MADTEKESLGIKVTAWGIMIAMLPGLIGVLDGLKAFGQQTSGWFRNGTWEPQTTWEALHYWGLANRPTTGWYVPDAILDWFLDGARWFWMPLLGIVYMGVVLWVVIAGSAALERADARRKGQPGT